MSVCDVGLVRLCLSITDLDNDLTMLSWVISAEILMIEKDHKRSCYINYIYGQMH